MSNRLSRESSQDILVEDLDRLSTTSAMSESSVSHRLNDVQDVQDIARMQEESLKHSTPLKQRSDTISPLSEHSLSSPVEESGGYQSEVTMLANANPNPRNCQVGSSDQCCVVAGVLWLRVRSGESWRSQERRDPAQVWGLQQPGQSA